MHNLNFTKKWLTQPDRNRSCSLAPSNLLHVHMTESETQQPTALLRMRSSSICSLHTSQAGNSHVETPSSNLPAASPPNKDSRLSSQWQTLAGGPFNPITAERICQNVSSVLHITQHATSLASDAGRCSGCTAQ